MKDWEKSLIILWGAFALSGCSMEASIESLSKNVSEVFSKKATPSEVVPSSGQGVHTSQGYEVQSSLSYYRSSPEVVTSQGYTVQTNVQSMIFKE